MISEVDNGIVRENTLPIRIMGNKGERHICTPYELAPNDDITLSFLNEDKRIVMIHAKSREKPSIFGGFDRHFLYSTNIRNHIITMRGYTFTEPVDVYSWKIKYGKLEHIRPEEREDIDIVSKIQLEHVCGLENAIEAHMQRIKDLDLIEVSLQYSLKIYETMQGSTPRT